MRPAVITVAQQKGGAGKTTLVIQLATALTAMGRKVALVDIDPQGSLTGWMRLREHRQRDGCENDGQRTGSQSTAPSNPATVAPSDLSHRPLSST